MVAVLDLPRYLFLNIYYPLAPQSEKSGKFLGTGFDTIERTIDTNGPIPSSHLPPCRLSPRCFKTPAG